MEITWVNVFTFKRLQLYFKTLQWQKPCCQLYFVDITVFSHFQTYFLVVKWAICLVRCNFLQFSCNCGLTQMVSNLQIQPIFVCNFYVDGWLLLWCEEVLAIIHLVSVDGNQFYESKMVYKWHSKRKPTSPFELPMFLCDDLHMDEGLTLVLWQTVKGTRRCSS